MSKMTRGTRRALAAKLQVASMDEALVLIFGRETVAAGHVVYDETEDLWIESDPHYTGDGFGFLAVARDKTWFRGVVPARHFQ